jgi:hypothetical protein
MGKHYSNAQCFKKITKLNFNQLNIKKIKSTKIILEKKSYKKNTKKEKKTMWGNTVAIHNVLKKKITKLNSQPTQY